MGHTKTATNGFLFSSTLNVGTVTINLIKDFMKKIFLLAAFCLIGCGYSSVDNELIGQPKKIFHQTPLICPNRSDVDISLGVMRDGVGSMSSQDMFLTVNNPNDLKTLESAIADGKLVKIKYNDYRFTWCQLSENVTSVTVVEGSPQSEKDKKKHEIDELNKKLHQLQNN